MPNLTKGTGWKNVPTTVKIYSVRDNRDERRKMPIAVFETYEIARSYAETIVEECEEKGISYDYDIEETTISTAIVNMLARAIPDRKIPTGSGSYSTVYLLLRQDITGITRRRQQWQNQTIT